jgi:thiamine biosynthesis lipoprotein
MKFKKKILAVLILFFISTGCNLKKEVLLSGRTMGTTYNIKVVTWFYKDTAELKDKIEKGLKEVNNSMSVFIDDSEISRFNRFNSRENFFISDDFFRVMTVARKIYGLSGGAWDGTVSPLVNLWGFGRAGNENRVPQKKEIEARLANVGFDKIEMSENGYLAKKNPLVGIDLGSIAKGYGVDRTAEVIRNNGISNFLVEIGGEVYASGHKITGGYWLVGINTPDKDSLNGDIYKTIRLKNKALATSGDYRNFFEKNGKSYSHIIDPKTGYPVNNGIVSVSVVANDCTFADGLATAILVTGHKKGLEIVNKLTGVECLVVIKNKDGTLTDYFSKGFGNDEKILFER